MINEKYVSISHIIENVYRNAGYQQIDWSDAIENVSRFFSLIGINNINVTKNCEKDIKDHTCILPVDLIKINQIMDKNTGICLTYSQDNFILSRESLTDIEPYIQPIDNECDFTCMTEEEFNNDTTIRAAYLTYLGAFQTSITDAASNPTNKYGTILRKQEQLLTYTLQNNNLYTSFKTGTIIISYKAVLLDEQGFPLVPDDEHFKRALEMFLQERIDYKLWRQGRLPDKVYNQTKQDYLWAIASARTHMNTPSVDEMETLKNIFTRLNFNIYSHRQGFKQ